MLEVLSGRDRLRASKQNLENLVNEPGAGQTQVVPEEMGELVDGKAAVQVSAPLEVVADLAVDDGELAVEVNTATDEEVGATDALQDERMLEGPAPIEDNIAEGVVSVVDAVASSPTLVDLANAISQVKSVGGEEARLVAENRVKNILSRWDESVTIPKHFRDKIDALQLDDSKPIESTAVEAKYPVKDQVDREGVLFCVSEAIANTINFPAETIEQSYTIRGDLTMNEAKLQEVLDKLGVQMLQFNLTDEATVDDLVTALSIQYQIGEEDRVEEVIPVEENGASTEGETKGRVPASSTTVEPQVGKGRLGSRLRDAVKNFTDEHFGVSVEGDTRNPVVLQAQESTGGRLSPSAADVLKAIGQVEPASVEPPLAEKVEPQLIVLPEQLSAATLSMEEVITKVRSFIDTDVAEAIKAGNENTAKIQAELAKLGDTILANIAEVRAAMANLQKPEQVNPAVNVVKDLLRLAVSAKVVSPEALQLPPVSSVADLAQDTEKFLTDHAKTENLAHFASQDKASLELLVGKWWRVLVDVVRPDQQKSLIDKELVPLLLLEAKVRLLKRW